MANIVLCEPSTPSTPNRHVCLTGRDTYAELVTYSARANIPWVFMGEPTQLGMRATALFCHAPCQGPSVLCVTVVTTIASARGLAQQTTLPSRTTRTIMHIRTNTRKPIAVLKGNILALRAGQRVKPLAPTPSRSITIFTPTIYASLSPCVLM
jgi:hypothetical protein